MGKLSWIIPVGPIQSQESLEEGGKKVIKSRCEDGGRKKCYIDSFEDGGRGHESVKE